MVTFTGLVLVNDRTLSGVTRRADARDAPEGDRRVTFDRAVSTKPLAFAADAASSAMCVQASHTMAPYSLLYVVSRRTMWPTV